MSCQLTNHFKGFIGKLVSSLRHNTAKKTDNRISLMSEIINGIKVIKMYTWEKPFALLISIARGEEIKNIKRNAYLKTFNFCFHFVAHKLIMLAILVIFWNVENKPLKASDVFLTLALYYEVRLSMTRIFPQCVALFAECQVSLKRIQAFLELDEVAHIDVEVEDGENRPVLELDVKNVSVRWKNNENMRSNNALNDISFRVESSQMCAIIGAVGSGKSTLLHAILGELPIYKGEVNLHGSTVSYAAQEPWIFSSTVRQNITFNQRFNEPRYAKVIEVTALDVDIKRWDDGDQTLVGHRGIILSGGQKARINLARCIYKDADIYLLDDPLSAVDANVGKHLYEFGIRGFLSEKVIILATHQVHYLKDADEILVMKDGAIASRGTLDILEMENFVIAECNQSDKGNVQKKSNKNEISVEKDDRKQQGTKNVIVKKRKNPLKLYTKFFTSGGNIPTWVSLITCHIITHTLYTVSDIFLGYWMNQEETVGLMGNSGYNSAKNIYIFTGLNLGIFIFSVFRTVLLFFVCLKSAETLHNSMFSHILYTNSRFFDLNPAGKILNRFSKDLGAVDDLLPQCMYDVCFCFALIFSTFITTVYYKPILIPPIFVIFVIFYYLRTYYMESSKRLKRIEASTKAPIFSQLSSTLDGLVTVRASQAGPKLISQFDQKQDLHSSAYYTFYSSTRWLGICLDCVGITFLTLCILSFLFIDGKSVIQLNMG